MARVRPCSFAALLLFAQFCVAALAKKGSGVPVGFVTTRPGTHRTVLQTDGSAEIVERLFLHYDPKYSPKDFEYFQLSSSPDTLNVARGTENVLATETSHGTNVTCTLSFDNMVGVTKYTIGVRSKLTKQVVYSKDIEYTVVGMVLYQKGKDGSRTVLNTEGSRGLQISYQDAMEKEVKPENCIHCFIQYADGTSSNDFPKGAKKIVKGSSLMASAPVNHHQFQHSTSKCDFASIGTYSPSTGIKLANGCGFGFYWNPEGELCFGINFLPYRRGKARLHWAWQGLAWTSGDLAEEVYESNMDVDITGKPPVAVTHVDPIDRPFRHEGGEIINCTFINGDIHDIANMRFQIGDDTHCAMVPGSLNTMNGTEFSQSCLFVAKPGRGGPLDGVMQYSEKNDTSAKTSTFKDAAMMVKYPIKYDEKQLEITKMSPMSGTPDGGTVVTISGYFGHFSPDRDSIAFSGKRISDKYIISHSSSVIKFRLPPKSDVGDAFEYMVSVHVGGGACTPVRFFYRMKGGLARISQAGTSYLTDNTYRVGDCTPLRFTLQVAPLTPQQIKSFKWTLKLANETDADLFETMSSLKSVDTSKPTIEFLPEQLGPNGNFILTGLIILHSHTLKKEIALQRDNVINIGAFILQPPERSVTYPRSPVRLIAVVDQPGDCYKGGAGMQYEWTVFGKTMTFNPANLTKMGRTGKLVTQISRLGRELLIPQDALLPGKHKVKFRVSMSKQPDVFGEAETTLVIKKDSLVPVIRYGESELETNALSNLTIFATNSYDPGAVGSGRTADISYTWSCNQSSSANFTEDTTKPCSADILPDSVISSPSFSVGRDALDKVGDHSFLRFGLTISKEGDVQNSTMDCRVVGGASKPVLDKFSFEVEDADGNPLPLDQVPPYENIVIRANAFNTSWSYKLLEPALPDFKFFEMLLSGDSMYSPGAGAGEAGNTKPLGLLASKMSSHTKFKVQISFAGTAEFAPTSCVVSFRTAETPSLGILNPTPKSGNTLTKFTATAGLPMDDARFSYYFHMTDLEGNRVCVGGCTGYSISHFSVMRPGTYSLTVSLYDNRGRVLLDKKTMPTPIVIGLCGKEGTFLPMLDNFFANGDDVGWAQLATDLTIPPSSATGNKYMSTVLLTGAAPALAESPGAELAGPELLGPEETPYASLPNPATRQGEDPSSPPSSSPSGNSALEEARMGAVKTIAEDARGISCSSVPNSQQGRTSIEMLERLLEGKKVDRATWFNCLYVLMCALENVPPGSGADAAETLPGLLARFYVHAQKLDADAVKSAGEKGQAPQPGNMFSDIAVVTGRLMVRAVAAGKPDGFSYESAIGKSGEFGHVALFTGSASQHLTTGRVNGELRRIVPGRTKDELFYIRPQRFGSVFTGKPADKRYIVLHTVPNFVVKSRLQDEPPGNNLNEDLYWVQMFEGGESGIAAMEINAGDPSFCMRMPVTHHREDFDAGSGVMPGMYACKDIKQVGEFASEKGLYFNYVFTGMKVVEWNVTDNENWVEACHRAPGLFGATAVTKTSGGAQAVGLERAVLLGQQGSLLAALVTGGLLLVVFVIAGAWLMAMNTSKPAPRAVPGGYVERDGYGRQGAAAVAAPTSPEGAPSPPPPPPPPPPAAAAEDVVSPG